MESTSETSLYSEESSYPSKERMKNLKKSMTLDLDAPSAKRQKFSCILSTPDLNMLKLGSPELEKLIMQQGSHLTATPTPTQSQYVFPKHATEEQESYVRGFEEALAELHGNQRVVSEEDQSSCDSQDNSNSGSHSEASTCLSSSSASAQSAVMTNYLHTELQRSVLNKLPLTIKEELQTVPSRGLGSPPMSPINLADQERIKLERKRLRNRMAATKCRKMKLERISKLESKVNELKSTNDELSDFVSQLKDKITHLKEQLMEHASSGCKVIVPQQLLKPLD
ncbi:hypothetical protein CHUAL_012530 [Chamberlinius hualienensis]